MTTQDVIPGYVAHIRRYANLARPVKVVVDCGNGVASLIEHLGSGFIRFRLGIGPKQPPQMELSDFVLGRFSPEQQSVVQQQLPAYVTGLELLLEQGAEPAMNQLNRRDQK